LIRSWLHPHPPLKKLGVRISDRVGAVLFSRILARCSLRHEEDLTRLSPDASIHFTSSPVKVHNHPPRACFSRVPRPPGFAPGGGVCVTLERGRCQIVFVSPPTLKIFSLNNTPFCVEYHFVRPSCLRHNFPEGIVFGPSRPRWPAPPGSCIFPSPPLSLVHGFQRGTEEGWSRGLLSRTPKLFSRERDVLCGREPYLSNPTSRRFRGRAFCRGGGVSTLVRTSAARINSPPWTTSSRHLS